MPGARREGCPVMPLRNALRTKAWRYIVG